MFRNIIWDVDGTLFDTYPAMARAFKSALNDFGQDAALEWIESLAKVSLGHCASTLVDQCHVAEADLDRAFGEHYARIRPEDQPPFPGVVAICEYICTHGGKNVIVTHRGQAGTRELLTANKLTQYFAGCIARDDGYPRKPHPAAFEAALNLYNLPREETLAVGDRDIDVLAGQAAGLFTCLFSLEAGDVAADITISRFDELYRYLASERNRTPVDSSPTLSRA